MEGGYWTVAGTVFSNIDGEDGQGGVVVRVTDSEGTVVEVESNRSGNFLTNRSLVPPLSAEVELDGEVKAMSRTVNTGACNRCHQCDGVAQGKIYAP